MIPELALDATRARLQALAMTRADLSLVVLFGSVARRNATVHSDVDVAVRCDAVCDLDTLFMHLAPVFRTGRLDLVELRRAQERAIAVFLEGSFPHGPIDAAILRRKFGYIAEGLRALAPLGRLSIDEYRARLYERKAAERLLQETIEAALDINAHVIAEHGGTIPEDYFGGFIALVTLGILSEDLARELAPSAGLP